MSQTLVIILENKHTVNTAFSLLDGTVTHKTTEPFPFADLAVQLDSAGITPDSIIRTIQIEREDSDSEDIEVIEPELLLQEAADFCHHHVDEFAGMPMEYEYDEAVFSFQQLCHLLSEDTHKALSEKL